MIMRVALSMCSPTSSTGDASESARCCARPDGNHLGWGNGAHTCVGIHLAKLEMRLLLEAMVPRVETIAAGHPERLLNNTLQGIARLPASFAAGA
jgi:cytochrome P450